MSHCSCAGLASRPGPRPAPSAATRCPGIAWSAGWAASASWGPPSVRRSCPSISWPTSIINPSTARRSPSPRPSAAGAASGPEPAGRAGTDDLKAAYEVFKGEAHDIAPEYVPKAISNRRLERDASGLEGPVQAGDPPSVFLARVAQEPRPCQALERPVRGRLPTGLGGVSCPRPPQLWATPPLTAAVGDGTPNGGRLGERPGPVRQADPLVDRLPPQRRPVHQQHARLPDAGVAEAFEEPTQFKSGPDNDKPGLWVAALLITRLGRSCAGRPGSGDGPQPPQAVRDPSENRPSTTLSVTQEPALARS